MFKMLAALLLVSCVIWLLWKSENKKTIAKMAVKSAFFVACGFVVLAVFVYTF